MRMIYRLTVQTLPDGLGTQFTSPDTTRQYCLVVCGGRCELGIRKYINFYQYLPPRLNFAHLHQYFSSFGLYQPCENLVIIL